VNALGKSAFFPFTVLLNAVLSMTTKWQYYGESAIRASGIEYTIVRPPKLVDEERCEPPFLPATPSSAIVAAWLRGGQILM
jgi:uncharacterized protein YbjT (DUF2867 family)